MDISAFQNIEEKVPDTEESKELRAIRKEFEKFDEAYVNSFVEPFKFFGRQYEQDKTDENRLLFEIAREKFYIEEARYYGYKQILENPEDIKEIKKRVKEEIAEMEAKYKAYTNVLKNLEDKKTEQLKIQGA